MNGDGPTANWLDDDHFDPAQRAMHGLLLAYVGDAPASRARRANAIVQRLNTRLRARPVNHKKGIPSTVDSSPVTGAPAPAGDRFSVSIARSRSAWLWPRRWIAIGTLSAA